MALLKIPLLNSRCEGNLQHKEIVCVFTWMLFSEIGIHSFLNELRSVQYLGVMSCETQS